MSSSSTGVTCYSPQTKLREGNVFTRVCHSVQRRGGLPTGVVLARGLPIDGVCLHGGGGVGKTPPSWNAFFFHIHLFVHIGGGVDGR